MTDDLEVEIAGRSGATGLNRIEPLPKCTNMLQRPNRTSDLFDGSLRGLRYGPWVRPPPGWRFWDASDVNS